MDIDMNALKKQAKESLRLVSFLLATKRDEMNSITKEYVDKLLETANLNPKDFDMVYEEVWSYVIGFCCGRLAGKEGKDKNGIDK